jgi:hypothetical protein
MSITVPYSQETSRQPAAEFAEDGSFTETIYYMTAWTDRYTFASQVRGTAHPSFAPAIARATSIEPFGKVTSSTIPVTWESAIIAVRYSTQDRSASGGVGGGSSGAKVDPVDGISVEEEYSPSAEFIVSKAAALYWASDDTDPVGDIESPGRLIRMQNLTIRMSNVPVAGFPVNCNQYNGAINSTALTMFVTGQTFAAETMQFNGATWSRQFSGDALSNLLTVSYNFNIRTYSWNLFYRTVNGPPLPLYLAGGTRYTPNELANFASVLNIKVA